MNTEKELNNDGGNAYPFTFENKSNHVVIIDGYELPSGHAIVNTGMTLRDYFAAKFAVSYFDATSNLIINSDGSRHMNSSDPADIANVAYNLADAMLAERAK